MKLNEPGMQKLEKAKFLAVGEACSACYYLTHSRPHGLLAKKALIFAFMMLHKGMG